MKIIDDNIIDITEESIRNNKNVFKKHKEKRENNRKHNFNSVLIQLLLINQLIIYIFLDIDLIIIFNNFLLVLFFINL